MAFPLKRDDPMKVDLTRLEKVPVVDTADILTKPIEFNAAKQDKKGLKESSTASAVASTAAGDDKKAVWVEKDPHEGVLMELCGCQNCLKYRESVIHFYVEECEYNILWFRLQQIIEKHYELIDE